MIISKKMMWYICEIISIVFVLKHCKRKCGSICFFYFDLLGKENSSIRQKLFKFWNWLRSTSLCHYKSFYYKRKFNLSSKEFSENKLCRMYEKKQSSNKCPLKALETYFPKMKDTFTALFALPAKVYENDWFWGTHLKLRLATIFKTADLSSKRRMIKIYEFFLYFNTNCVYMFICLFVFWYVESTYIG